MDLPDPPKRELNKKEMKAIAHYEKALRLLLPEVQKLNALTDVIDDEVDIRTVDRGTRDRIVVLMWQGEFIEMLLKHSHPTFAMIDLVKFMSKNMSHAGIEVREVSPEEAHRLGYL